MKKKNKKKNKKKELNVRRTVSFNDKVIYNKLQIKRNSEIPLKSCLKSKIKIK